MRLNQRRRGDCYYNNNIGATRSQGIWAFSLVILWLLISLRQHQRRRGAPGMVPGYAPFRSNANERLIFCNYKPQRLTQHRLLTSTAPDASKKSRPY